MEYQLHSYRKEIILTIGIVNVSYTLQLYYYHINTNNAYICGTKLNNYANF